MRALVGLLLAATSLCAGEPVHGVYRSADGGKTWWRSDAGLAGNSRINAFGSMNGVVFAGTDGGIYRSRDEGRHWRRVGGGTDRVTSFATVGGEVYAGTDRRGILISTDKGMTWSAVARFPAKNVRRLVAHEGRLHAGTDTDGVLFPVDEGRTWESIGKGLPAQAQVFALSVWKGQVFAGLYAKGLYRWVERERRWVRSGNVVPLVLAASGERLVAGHNPGGLLWSEDGERWQRAASADGKAPVWEVASGAGMVFAGVADGIYYSEDEGRRWVRARKGLPAESPGIAFLVEEGFVLAATAIRGTEK